ncbi:MULTISPECIES: DUF2332 domain-containing protein [unclassified Bacillus (in: firmicutes)]|uniref:DUF2332 domain-containing protein n=1 Tax=unclassified Bacillus (in: firmicutes) TaxID=185979 RepID=UPI000B885B68|nr:MULTISPECIES: DUF2332 domain-containing protein [unclassified Bacillus (in: firmicutes)]
MIKMNQLSERFLQFAKKECRGSSELYEYLSMQIAQDDEVLYLCEHVQKGQPVPNLLFGAVHYLLLKGKDHTLKEYYQSLVKEPKSIECSFPIFKEFCMTFKEEVISILQTKLVQTNEVRRCAYLYPAFCYIYERMKKPLALVEIGTSAGLQLLWDQYSYSYGTGTTYGNRSSNVHITSEIRSSYDPLLFLTAPPVTQRIGLDLHVNDVSNEENFLWLKALIWPEHNERRELFDKAAQYVKDFPIKFIEGDGVKLILNISSQIPSDSVLCIFHTHVANQIPLEGKKDLFENIRVIGENRDVVHLYNNMTDGDLHLDYFMNGIKYTHNVGKTDGHGRWFEWRLE